MNAKLVKGVKKLAAVATGALFLGATMGAASVFGQSLSSLPAPFVSNGHVNAVVVVGATASSSDVVGAIDIASALTASAVHSSSSSGFVTIGTLSLSSHANAITYSNANGTAFPTFSPASAALDKVNWTGSGKENYTSVENISFSGSMHPYLNGLNVVMPAGSFWLASYVVNRSASNAIVNLTDGLDYLIGATTYDLLNYTTKNVTFGVSQTFTNVKVPQTLTVGVNTVGLLGVASVTSSSGIYYQLEFDVNNGATNYVNFSKSLTVSGVTVTVGPRAITNTTGTFLSSLSVSSTSKVQNFSSANLFGLGTYNATSDTAKFFGASSGNHRMMNFTLTAKVPLNYSFSTASKYTLPDSLSTIGLEPLSAVYSGHGATNLTINVGTAGSDTIGEVPSAINASAPTTVNVVTTHGLSAVSFGTDYRGPLTQSGYGSPDLVLEPYQQIYNTSSGQYVNASSEYIYPYHGLSFKNSNYWANATHGITYAPSISGKAVRLVYVLPNGRYLAFYANNVEIGSTGDHIYVPNITTILNYTASTTSNPGVIVPVIGDNYSFNGYNVSVKKATFNAGINQGVVDNITITGPQASVTGGVSTYSITPGYSGVVAANGTSFASAPVTSTNLGTLSFSGSVLTYTDPVGGSESVTVAENKTNFNTYITSSGNTTVSPWGEKLIQTKSSATIQIPVQNYTLALGGSQVVTGETNYSVGSTVPAGEIISVGGVSAVSPSNLYSSGVFPLAELDSSFAGSANTVPVIVVGGPAVNTLAAELLTNSSTPIYGSQFTNLTGVSSGEAVIQMFSSVKEFGNQPALWVAGYGATDTLVASEVLSESLLGTPVVSLTGSKVILSTASGNYKGVSVV